MKNKRDKFRESVLKRDNNLCKICGVSGKIDAHHIMDRNYFPNGGYILSNGIALCDSPHGCHWKAEHYHRTNAQEVIQGYSPYDLYLLINSSFELAIKDDQENL